MTRRRIILVLALAAVAAGIVLFWPRGPMEPVYEGKGLGHWLQEAVRVDNALLEMQAQTAVKAIGTNALPFLVHEFTRPDSKWTPRFNRLVSAIGLGRLQKPTDQLRRMAAGHGLYILGPDAAPALPVMAIHLGDPQGRFDGAQLMASCGERAVPFFLKGIASTNQNEIFGGIVGLGELARKTESAIPLLIQLLAHTNEDVRAVAAVSLRHTRWRATNTIPALRGALSDPSTGVQYGATVALGEIGEAAKPAVPELRKLLDTTSGTFAAAISNALEHIDPAALPPRRP